MPELVRVEGPGDGVAIVTLDRAEKKNALSIQVRDQLSGALDGLAADDAARVVMITGAGDTFCAGFDLKEFDRLDDEAFAKRLWASADRYHRTVLEFPLPTIAAVNGPALAGGFDLAVMCDLRVASATARFAHPEVLFSQVVYAPLRDLVGGAVARELCFTGRTVDAEEALALRLVSAVVPAGELGAAARRLADGIAKVPRHLLVGTKAKALRRAGFDVGGALDL